MKVLYVTRGKQSMDIVHKLYHSMRDSLQYRDQDGFFEASLTQAAAVDVVSLSKAEKTLAKHNYDWVIVNWKQQGFADELKRGEAIIQLFSTCNAKKAVFVGAAQTGYLPPEFVLDVCDLVFKREPLRDKTAYSISPVNQKKMVGTMISCPFVTLEKNNLLARLGKSIRPPVYICGSDESTCEVGFSGADAAEHSLRRDVWRRVKEEGFSTVGGLQPNPYTKLPIPSELQGPRFKGKAYRDSLCNAKINLALDGIGEYTFRHQELLYLGAFMMSGPSIRKVELPMPLKEEEHYVAFNDLDDMVEKIRYYLMNDYERERIAASGKRLFDQYYDPVRHGRGLLAALKS